MKKLFTLFTVVICCVFAVQTIEAQDVTICLFEDVNGNGDDDDGSDITGATIGLLESGTDIGPMTDLGNGCYEFTGLTDGEDYCFSIDLGDIAMDAFTISGGDSEATTGTSSPDESICFTWNTGDSPTFNAGAFVFVEICGNVFQDCTNGTGVDGGNDYSDVEVEVLDDTGSAASDIDGNGYSSVSVSGSEFCFDMLTPGVEYLFQFTSNDPNFVPSELMNDNDMDQATEQTTVAVSGNSGDVIQGAVDAGYVELISICGVVFEDCNGDFQNNDGQAFDDADVEISGPGGAPITMPDGSAYSGSTSINPSGGDYCFDGLPPGDYVITITAQDNSTYFPTMMDGAGEAVDSDIDQTTGETPTITIENCAAGPIETLSDAGFFQAGCITGTYWHDFLGEGEFDGDDMPVDGGVVTITNENGPTVDVNGDAIGPAVTDGSGIYEFCDLPPGTYTIEFILPVGDWLFTVNSGALDDDGNSDPGTYGTNGQINSLELNTCDVSEITYVDAGIIQPVTIGGSIFIDQDNNGMQDGADGVNGILVNIYACDDCGGSPLASTLTADGIYAFIVAPGEFCIEIDPSMFEAGGPLAALFEVCSGTVDPNGNVDGDNNGSDDGIGSGGGVIIECAEITCPETPGDPLLNLTFDFCFITGACDDPNNFPFQLQDNCDDIAESIADQDPDNDLVICDLAILDAFCGSMYEEDTGNGPSPLCSDGGTPHNITWFGFVAGTGDFDIVITPLGCEAGGGGQLGMQAGLYTDCTFDEEVWCASIPCSTEAINTSDEDIDWVPGQVYYFFFDGCAGSVCDFEIDVICNSSACDPFQLPPPTNWALDCDDGYPPCVGGTYDVSVQGYEDFDLTFFWNINLPNNGGVEIEESGEGLLSYTFDNGPGDYEVCFTVNNGCTLQGACEIFTIVELDDIPFLPIMACGEDIVVPEDIDVNGITYEWDGDIEVQPYDANGTNTYVVEQITTTDCGCVFIQSVDITVIPDSDVMDDLIVVCPGQFSFDYDGSALGGPYPTVTIDAPGLDQEIIFEDQFANGCNLLVSLDVYSPEIVGELQDLGCMDQAISIGFVGSIEPAADVTNIVYTWYDGGDNLLTDSDMDDTVIVIPEVSGVDDVYLIISVDLFGTTCEIIIPEIDVNFIFPEGPELTEDPPTAACATGGTVFYSIEDPIDGYVYQWTLFGDPDIGIVDGQGTSTIEVDWTGVTVGSAFIEVIAINECGLESEEYFEPVDVFDAPDVDFVFADNPCPGDIVTFTYSGDISVDGWVFTWDFGANGTIVSSTSPDEEGPHDVIFTAGGIQSISLTVESAPGCDSQSLQNINVAEPLPAPAISCGDSDVDFVIFEWVDDPNIVNYSYMITPSGNNGTTMTNSVTEMGLVEGEVVSIMVWGVDVNGCVSDTAMIDCQALDCTLPSVEIQIQSNICEDDAAIAIDTMFTPAFGAIVGLDTIYVDGIPVESGMFDPALYSQGPHSITYTFIETSTGCIMNSPSVNITIDTVPDLVATVVDDTICITENIFVTLNAVPLNWTITPDGTIVSGSGVGPYEINFPTAGNKQITVDAANALNPNCVSAAQVLDIVVDPELIPPNFMCGSTQTTATYTWTVDPNAMYTVNDITGLGTGDLDLLNGVYTLTNLTQGDITEVELVVTSLNDCPGVTVMASCEAVPCPSYDVTIDPNNIPIVCQTTPIIMYSATVTTGGNPAMGGTGVWSSTPSNIIDANTGEVDPSALASGMYTITYDYLDDNGCPGQATIDVEVINPEAVIAAADVICEDDVLTVSAGAVTGNSIVYDWDLDGGTNLTPIGAGPFDVEWDMPGVYTISLVLIVDGCTTEPATHQVTVDPSVGVPNIDCTPTLDDITFFWDAVDNASGYEIDLDGDITTQAGTSITATGLVMDQMVNITVTALSNGACPSQSASLECEPVPCPDINLNPSATETSVCSADVSTVTLSSGMTGSDGSGTGGWSGTGVDPNTGVIDITTIPAGSYTYDFNFSEGGCDFMTSISIDVFESPSIELMSVSPDCYLNNVGELTVTPTVSTAGFTISINGAAGTTETMFTDLAPNQYNVVITDDNGCQASASTTITGVSQPSISISGSPTIVAGQDGGPYGFNTNLDPSMITDIIWTLNDTTILCTGASCTSVPLIQPMEDGVLCVDVFYGADCVISDCTPIDVRVIQEIVVTNIFSPNGQPGNTEMTIYSSDRSVTLNSVQIFDRWGNLVYELPRTEFANGNLITLWNGRLNGSDVAGGVYVYSMEIDYGGFVEVLSGDVTVLR